MSRRKKFFLALFSLAALLATFGNGTTGIFTVKESGNPADALVGASMAAASSRIDLAELQGLIKEKGAGWEAGETSVSGMSQEEKSARVAKGDVRLTKPGTPQAVPPVKARAIKLDWRNNGGNYVTPVKDQGNCGACWAFSTTATAESASLLKNKTPYAQAPIDLSEQVMLSCSGAGTCGGGMQWAASYFLQTTGLPAESCYGYTGTEGNCASACANWQDTANKIGSYVGISGDVGSIKNALASYGPISTVMNVYADFYYYKKGVYRYTAGDYVGGHAVSVIGYDDTTQSFLAKNSWGTGWGENGFFRIAYSEIGSVVGFGRDNLSYNVPAPDLAAPIVHIGSPSDGATVSGAVSVMATGEDNVAVTLMEIYIDGAKAASANTGSIAFSWNTKKAAPGQHAIRVSAKDGAGNIGDSTVSVNVIRR